MNGVLAIVSPWADPAVPDRLAALWHGNSASRIAAMLKAEFGIHLSRNAVIGKALRMGLTGHSKAIRHNMQCTPKALRPVVINQPKPKAAPKPRPPVVGEPVPFNYTLAELPEGGCHYPFGDGSFVY